LLLSHDDDAGFALAKATHLLLGFAPVFLLLKNVQNVRNPF